MQLYILDMAYNTLATTSKFYNDKHHKELTAGASTYQFTLDKTDPAAKYIETGNHIVFQDDRGKPWSFSILNYDENQISKTVYSEDVGIELLNKSMDVWAGEGSYPFSYYFGLIAKDTPWEIGVNEISSFNRTLTYTGRDTGLGRLLSVLKGFDNAECIFRIETKGNRPVKFIVDVYKQIGTIQDNIQIIYNQQLDDIKKTESRAAFVTALAGVGGVIQPEIPTGTTTTTPVTVDTSVPQEHIDFTDLEYKDDNYETKKGDKFLRAITANKLFNPGNNGYIESFYDYDTQSAQELLNRTLTRLKTYSEPQYSYTAEVKVIDPTLDLGDTVKIIDHDYNPALYLSARVASFDKSYTDASKNTITFTNYQILNSSLADKIYSLQQIINSMPSASAINAIAGNLSAQFDQLKKQVLIVMESTDGKHNFYIDARPSNAKEGDSAFVTNNDGQMEIYEFKDGLWQLNIGLATGDKVDEAIKEVSDKTDAAQKTADEAVEKFDNVNTAIQGITETTDQIKADTATATQAASSAFDSAKVATANAAEALSEAKSAKSESAKIATSVNDLTGQITTLATKQSVDELTGALVNVSTNVSQNANSIKLKADKTDIDTINKTVNSQATSIQQLATGILLKADATTVTQLKGDLDNIQIGARNLLLDTDFVSLKPWSIPTSNIVSNKDTPHGITRNTVAWLSTVAAYNGGLSQSKLAGKVVKDEIYTVSYWAKGGADGITLTAESNGQMFTSTLTTEWKYYSGQMTFGEDGRDFFLHETGTSKNNVIYLNSLKLEKGTVATDWSPAPEDTATSIDDLKDVVTKNSTALDINSKAIALKADQSVVDGIKGNITDLSTQVSTQADQIKLTATKTDITNSIKGLASETYVNSQISVSAESINQSVSKIQTDMTTKYSSLEETVNGFKTTVAGKADVSQISQLSNQITNVISSIDGDNFIVDGNVSKSELNKKPLGFINDGIVVITNPAKSNTLVATDAKVIQMKSVAAYNSDINGVNSFTVNSGETYYTEFKVRWDNMTDKGSIAFGLRCRDSSGNYSWVTGAKSVSPENWQKNTGVLTIPDNMVIAEPWLSWQGAGVDGHKLYITDLIIRRDTAAASQVSSLIQKIDGFQSTVSNKADKTQITQVQNDINLRVKSGEVISQINLTKETATIDAKHIHLGGTSLIDNGVITTAMIKDATITGAKIVDASIQSAKIAQLDGGKIAAGTITADKLEANVLRAGMEKIFGSEVRIADGQIQLLNNGNSNMVIAQDGISFTQGASIGPGVMSSGTPNWYSFGEVDFDIPSAYQHLRMTAVNMTGTTYPALMSADLKTGIIFGTYQIYICYNNKSFAVSKFIK